MNASAAEFRKAISPILELLSELMDGGMVSDVQIRHNFSPSVDSVYVQNLDEADRMKGPWFVDPGNEVQNVTLEKLGLAEDHIRAFVALLDSESPFAYAHHTVARATFEALAWARHLGPWNLFRERLRRVLNHQIQAAYDLLKLEEQIGTPIESGIKADKYLNAAGPLGFKLTSKGTFLEPGPPTTTDMLTDLFSSNETARVIYKHLSWSAHGELLGVRGATQLVEERSALTGQGIVGAGPNSTNVYVIGMHLAERYMAEAQRMAEYSGWLDHQWVSLAAKTETQLSAMKLKLSELLSES